MTTTGAVAHLIKSKDGDIGGILLTGGTIVDTPPGHGDALRALLKRGDIVKVEGVERRTSRGKLHVRAKRIALTPRRGTPEKKKHELKAFEISIEGFVESYAVNSNGDMNGFRLEDGTVVITPLRDGERLLAQVEVGDYVLVDGHRAISSRHGVKIVANRIQVQKRHVESETDVDLFGPDDVTLRT